MAHNNQPASVQSMDHQSTSPLSAGLRWGLGWTIIVATIGASVGLASASQRDDEFNTQGTYAACVSVLGHMPAAADHHIDACEAVRTATAARQTASRSFSSGIQVWYEACVSDAFGSADTLERWVERCADDAAAHIGHPRTDDESRGSADTLERQLTGRS